MGTFDGQIKTPTRVGLDRDAFHPSMGSLVDSSFAEEMKVIGTRNVFVTGNTTLKAMANVTASIMGNKTDTIMGISTKTISGAYTKVMKSNYNRQVMASEMTLTIGPTLKTMMGPVTYSNPTQTNSDSGDWFETRWRKGLACLFRTTNIGLDVTLRVTSTQLTIFKSQCDAIDVALDGLKNAFVASIRNDAAAICIATHLACANIRGIHTDVRGVRAGGGCEMSTPPTSLPGVQ